MAGAGWISRERMCNDVDAVPKILIIEDDPLVVKVLLRALTPEHGYEISVLAEPARAVEAVAAQQPDLVLLDVLLPGADGRQLLESLRRDPDTASVPVIIMSGLGSMSDRVLGLKLGADDYLPKPFSPMELTARIEAVLRRAAPAGAEGARAALRVGPLELDPALGTARLKGRSLGLRPREFEVLYLLASHPGRALTRAFLMENTAQDRLPAAPRSVDSQVKNIRQKLGAHRKLIATVPRRGYRLALRP